MLTMKLTRIGNSLGFVLPKEAAAKMHLGKGDTVYLTEAPDGYRVTPYDPAFEQQMNVRADHEEAPQRLA